MRQDFYNCSRLYGAIVLPVLLALAVLGGFGGSESAAQEDKIVLALSPDQTTMDPHMHFQRVGILMNIQMYDSLLHKTPKLEYEPSLATSWRAIDDTTWEFKLRQGVKFHNGDPFSAEDVKFSFERALDPATKSPQYGNIRAIKEVKIIDPHTVHLVTDKPFPLLIERMVFFPIIPKKHYEKVGAQAFGDSAPVGTGPYKFAEWKRDQFLRLERFDEHWRGPAAIKTLIIRAIPETSTQIAELKTGGVDIIRNLSPDLIPDLKAHASTYVSTAPILRTHYAMLDMREAPFNKKEARQAANYAIDRQAIVDRLMGGLGRMFAAEVACLTGDDFGAAIREVAKRFEIDSPLEMITASQYWIDVDPTMIGAIRALRKLGVRCALATNQQNLRGGYMRRSLGFGEVFDEQFYSHELGVAKPDPGYFRAILARIEVPAETVLFLDDRDENVEGAVAAGLPAEVFPRDGGAEALRAILARHGVRL